METPFDYLETTINGISLSDAYKLGFKAGQETKQKEIDSLIGQVADLKILKEQAEVESKQAGIKKVIEQVESKSRRVATNMSGINLSKEDWDAIKDQLKENDGS